MDLKKKTKSLIAMIYLNYLCDEEEKNNLNSILKSNEEKYQKELREKYNPDNIFKKNNQEAKEKIVEDNAQIKVYKEPLFKRIINKIKNIFHIL